MTVVNISTEQLCDRDRSDYDSDQAASAVTWLLTRQLLKYQAGTSQIALLLLLTLLSLGLHGPLLEQDMGHHGNWGQLGSATL